MRAPCPPTRSQAGLALLHLQCAAAEASLSMAPLVAPLGYGSSTEAPLEGSTLPPSHGMGTSGAALDHAASHHLLPMLPAGAVPGGPCRAPCSGSWRAAAARRVCHGRLPDSRRSTDAQPRISRSVAPQQCRHVCKHRFWRGTARNPTPGCSCRCCTGLHLREGGRDSNSGCMSIPLWADSHRTMPQGMEQLAHGHKATCALQLPGRGVPLLRRVTHGCGGARLPQSGQKAETCSAGSCISSTLRQPAGRSITLPASCGPPVRCDAPRSSRPARHAARRQQLAARCARARTQAAASSAGGVVDDDRWGAPEQGRMPAQAPAAPNLAAHTAAALMSDPGFAQGAVAGFSCHRQRFHALPRAPVVCCTAPAVTRHPEARVQSLGSSESHQREPISPMCRVWASRRLTPAG
jgi:hypothetical protein